MAPRQKAPVSGRGKALKSTSTSQKRSAAASCEGRKPKVQAKRRQFHNLLNGSPEEENAVIGSNSEHPIELKAPTSYAERKRRRATLSMEEIFAESSKKDEVPTDHAATFVAGSTALSTWGIPTSQPVPAVGNLRRHKGLRGFGVRRGKESAFVKFTYGSNPDDGDGGDDTTPFRFLDLPLEIRWRIYDHLLIHPKPILVYPDWHTVHATSPQDHTIIRASKQILLESTQFLYGKNVFHAVVSPRSVSLGLTSNPNDGFIKKEFLPYLRNVIVECRSETYPTGDKHNMIGATARCLQILLTSEALLDSVTIVLSTVVKDTTIPSTGTTALVLAHPEAGQSISEYFEAPASKIMRVIPKLRCKVLNIVLRLPEKKRLLVSINLRGLPVNQDKSGWLVGERVAQLSARKLAHQVKTDLIGLNRRFEDIFEDYEKAIMEGKARLMNENESLADGVKLASAME
jgi:hypothetical protein